MKRFVILACVVLLFAGPAVADCVPRARVVTYQQHQVYPSYVQHAVYVPVAVFEPIKAVYAVGGSYRQDSAEVAELARAMEKLAGTVDRLAGRAELAPALRAAEPVAAPRRDVPADDVSGRAWQVLSKHCASCHTGAQAKGKVTIFSEPGKPNPNVDLFLLWESADAGRMPKGMNPISDEEARTLRELVALAAKQRRAAQK